MKVYIKNKLVSLGGSSSVLNENQQPIYKVKGKVFSITKKKFIYDMQDKLLYVVRNKWFKTFLHSALIYDGEKNKIAKVKQKFWSAKYIVEDYSEEIELQANKIIINGEVVGTVSKGLSFIADHYTLEADEKDIEFLIALVIAKDNIRDRERKELYSK